MSARGSWPIINFAVDKILGKPRLRNHFQKGNFLNGNKQLTGGSGADSPGLDALRKQRHIAFESMPGSQF